VTAAGTGPAPAGPTQWITFLSDYGVEDACVGVCHGVIARHAPDVRVLDVCHAVAPQDIEQGAVMLADSVGYLPAGIHLVVVERLDSHGFTRGVAVRTADGSTFIAPDNGVTSLGWDALGGVVAAHEISNPALWLPLPSAVFRGRDVYAPVAARLSAGLPFTEVGPEIDQDTLVRLTRRGCAVDEDHVHAEVLAVDHFGNLSLNVTRSDLEAAGILIGDSVEIRAPGRELTLPFTHTYGDVPVGGLALCEDSLRRVMLAVNCGRAADLLRLGRRDALVIGQIPREPGAASRSGGVVRLPALA
jgi:S-adenosylmethionine hydrolase